MRMLRASNFVSMALCCVVFLSSLATWAQQGLPPDQRPNLQPGDRLEVIEGRAIKDAEFVEFTPVGLIKVRFDDDSQKAFRPNFVRLPKGVKPRPAAAKPAEATAPPTPVAAPGGVSRTWTDASGKFKIEAELISFKNGEVQLKRADGKIVTLKLEQLSVTDQEVAKALGAAMAAKAANDNPFEANVRDAAAAPGAPATPAAQGSGKEVVLSLQNAPAITLDAPATWSAKVDPSTIVPQPLSNRVSPIPGRSAGGRSDFFEGPTNMIVDSAHNWLWIGIKNEPPGPNSGKSYRLERLDLGKGSALAPVALPVLMRPLAVDPSGKYLAMTRDDDFHNRSKQLELWEIDGLDVKPGQFFKPYDRGDGKPHSINSVKWADFVDATHLLTLSDNGTLAMWNLAATRAEWLIELGGFSASCTLSPGRKQLAVATSSGVWMLDSRSGNPLGKFEMKDEGSANLHIYRVAFSDDGAQVAALGPLNLWIWNAGDGKITTSISGTSMPVGHEAALSFGQRGHVIVDHRYAFDVARGVMTCFYNGSWNAAVHHAGREWYLTETGSPQGKVRGIMQFVLPGEDVVKKAASVKEEDLLAIKPGSKISLVLNLPFDATEIEAIRASATERFKANEWTVVPDGEPSDFVLTCSTSVGESKEISYRMFGRGFATEKVTITYQHGEMTLQAPGVEKPIWQSKTTWGPPHFLHLKEGQTIEEATRTMPNPQYFANPAIPRRLMKYPNGVSIVSATLSPQGVTVQ
jgi:hypothetical protein